MTYAAADRSVQDGTPIELYTFTSQRAVDNVIAQSTSYHRNVSVLGGDVFTATQIKRSDYGIVPIDENTPEITVEVHALHPAAIFYRRQGPPPQNFECFIQRYNGGEVRTIYRGLITEAKQNGRTVIFTVTGRLDEPLATKFPSIQVSALCQHQLYDSLCTMSRAANQTATTIATLGDGRTISVASIGAFAIDRYQWGELLHVASGERRMIAGNAAPKTFALDVRLPTTALVGDAVTIWRGCNRTLLACRDLFDNVQNFGGHPQLKTNRFLWNFPGLFRHGQ